MISFLGKNRFFILLITLFSYLIIGPFFSHFPWVRIVINIFLTLMLLSSLYAVGRKKWTFMVAGLLLIPLLIFTWMPNSIVGHKLNFAGTILNEIFILFITVILLSYVFKEYEVTSEVISGAIVVYLMLGVFWANIYRLLEYLAPGSFHSATELDVNNHLPFIYYSFVTITTLGYGDIKPTSDVSKSFAILEAIIGQLYMTILVARLVGINISQWLARKRT